MNIRTRSHPRPHAHTHGAALDPATSGLHSQELTERVASYQSYTTRYKHISSWETTHPLCAV